MTKILSSVGSQRPPKFTYVVKKRYWRFRHRLTGNRALPGQPGEPEFHRAYAECLDQIKRLEGRVDRTAPPEYSLEWLMRAYRKAPEFTQRKPRTRADYAKVMDYLVEKAGDLPYTKLTRKAVYAIRDGLAATPRKANYAVQVISIVMNWAIDRGDLKDNPAKKIKKLDLTGKGYKPWSEPEIAEFLTKGKPHIVLGVMLHLFTGQRAGDIVIMERDRYKGNEIEVRQNKTGELLPLATPRQLREALEARPFREATTLLVGERGKPYATEISWMQALKREVRRIGLSEELSSHGLRYAAAARLEESGCSIGVIVSLVGHRSYQMAMQYATKRRDSQQAARVMEQNY